MEKAKMEVTGDNAPAQTPQTLNDLQNLLLSFNKEIEDQPVLVQPMIDQPGQHVYVATSRDPNMPSQTVESSSSQSFAGFYTEQNILDSSLHDDSNSPMAIVVTTPTSLTQEQDVHVSPDSLAQQIHRPSSSSTSSLTDSIHASQDISLQEINPNELTTLNDAEGNVLRIVSIGNDGQMHIINEEQLQQGSEITTDQLTQQVDEKVDGGETTLDGTDPVAVLASVAANTSSVSQIQTVTLNQGDINNPQLVAIQNSADSSQPQLVAVQNADGTSTEAVQIIGSSEVANINQALMASNSSFQTVTLVPSETGPGGEVSYVLIMGSPDGENVIDGKTLSLDLSSYDFKDEGREVTEELVEEDGKTRRILRITPKAAYTQGQMMCSYCNYTSPKRYLLTRHMKTHSEDRPHKCHICGRGFKTLASLNNHVNTHTGVRPHKCKLCESAFTTSGELVRHVRYKHTFEKPHKCTMCEYASVELSKLKRHMRSHTGERPYQCPHCTYASPDTYKLKRHLRIHTGEKPYECMVCHARFTQSNSLKAHKLIHTGTKPVFQCEFCPTTCGRRTDLKIHVQKLHNSEHPLLCRKCEQTFPDRYTYKMHLKSHEGEKCFKCDTCGHAAVSQRHLETHQLIHTGEKPYECHLCDLSFRQKQLLKRHQSLHHGISETGEGSEKPEDGQETQSIPYKNFISQQIANSINQIERNTSIDSMDTETANSLITQNILEKNLMQEWRDGKLGNAQQVVIVHPDGTVEEVTHKLQSFQSAEIQDGDEAVEIKPELCQFVKHEVTSEDETSDLVISAVEEADQQLDETKEAGTQAEFECDADEGIKKIDDNNGSATLISTSTSDITYIKTIDSSRHTFTNTEAVQLFNPSVDQTDEGGTLGEEEALQPLEFVQALDDRDIENLQNTSTVVIQQCEEEPEVEPADPTDNVSEEQIESYNEVSDMDDEVPQEQLDSQDLLSSQVDDPSSSVEDTSTNSASITPVKNNKSSVSSPDRQTRSMKRKETVEARSPAKRTRRSTME